MALSPMMKFYLTLKESYQDAIVLFRLGDFYEMFFEDAKIASEILDLTLTGRDCGLEERAPMCGVPYHAVDGYISKLIAAGHKVAICEQLSDPKESKGMVDRDVVRVITPGTVIEDDILESKRNNYLACVMLESNHYAIAWLDISTGEFRVLQDTYSDFSAIEDMLATIAPAEILANSAAYEAYKSLPTFRQGRYAKMQAYPDWAFGYDNATKILTTQLQIATLQVFEFADQKASVGACGALMQYVAETQKRTLAHLSNIVPVRSNEYLILDANTRRNLEITEPAHAFNGKKGTLLYVLDVTRTSMGARNLRRWLEQPLRNPAQIQARLDAVAELVENHRVRNNLEELLSRIKDVERLTSKIAYGNPGPRDLVALRNSLAVIPEIKQWLDTCHSDLIKRTNEGIFALEPIFNLLDDAICDEPPVTVKDGGFIRQGYCNALDDLRQAKERSVQWLAELEAKEREETQIKNLKISYNRVFGYYIEVSKSNLDKVPFRYQRKQTLANGERYITEELKQIENKLLNAADQALATELQLFDQIKSELLQVLAQLQSTARGIATLDTLYAFASVSVANRYCKPELVPTDEATCIKDGRHPVVEALLKHGQFVPNDTTLDLHADRTMIITGPNMAGKSTYMRQVALITLMAHSGCFVPASSAKIALTDRIFTRIGASDDVAFGQSTFMVEMVEVATILHNATRASLLILDEIGRGTSSLDGLSIARAVLEDVNMRIGCRTLFSTHYHELTDMEHTHEGIRNFKIVAAERNNGIVFLHKIMRGGTNKSFGIEVAKLAGVPKNVIKRAKELSAEQERNAIVQQLSNDDAPLVQYAQIATNSQKNASIVDALAMIDVNALTPMQALTKLSELVHAAQEEKD